MSKVHFTAITVLGVIFAASACDETSGPVTYHKDIAPLMEKHCTACHLAGNIGPFPLGTYEEVKGTVELVRVATKNRTMPPSNVDNSGDCKSFVDARWMEDDEIALIEKWMEDGLLEGDPAHAPTTSTQALTETLDGETVEMRMKEPYTPLGNEEYPFDDYRCFILDVATDSDKFVTGFEILPDVRAQVHHVLIAAILNEETEADAFAKDAADDTPGWECFGGSGLDDVNLLGVWAPGRDVTNYPEGTGLRIKGGQRVVIEMHYNMASGAVPDMSGVKLELADEVDAEAIFGLVAADDFDLEPGQESVSYSQSYPLTGLIPSEGLLMYGVFPHMHQLGRSMDFTIKRAYSGADAPETCLMDVPNWDFNWQQGFFYDDPIPVTVEDEVKVRCTWDTRGVDHNVVWGEGTADEMCLVFTYITLMNGGPVDQYFD